jgi:hypothetical protein
LLPSTWRLGISGANGTVNQIYPVDLALNTDYQVVVGWNPTSAQVDQLFSLAASLWVNPINSSDIGLPTGDIVTSPAVAQGYAFRQASSSGTWFGLITNLAVATSFDEASFTSQRAGRTSWAHRGPSAWSPTARGSAT